MNTDEHHSLPVTFFASVSRAFGGRAPPAHRVHKIAPFAHEDSLETNTQVSSQWDGLRHFGFRSTGQFYNEYTQADFEEGRALGTDAWIRAGSIVGRGVLVDFHTWAASEGIEVYVNGGFAITLDHVKRVLLSQNTAVQPGDVLIFRTGWLSWFNATSEEERYAELCERHAPGTHHFAGLAQEEEFVQWLWENQIAAVAGDAVAFECTPPPAGGFGMLHEHLLGALGCPMGELFDTETLSEECRKRHRYSFFFTSAPLYVPGGVASPCNSLALF